MKDFQNITYRKATPNDVMLYFDWANDPAVRVNSFNSEKINLENHIQWFQQTLKNPENLLLLFELEGKPFGQVRFQTISIDCVLNYSIEINNRGLGLGIPMITKAIEVLHDVRPEIIRITAKVKKENPASLKVLEKSGFHLQEESENERVYLYLINGQTAPKLK
jgi:RimJ/RimL family protein N-acetyltransferase